MPNHISGSSVWMQRFASLAGVALFLYLIVMANPRVLWEQITFVGYGIAVIIVLGGISHVFKTCAWRLTFTGDISRLSWRRSFALRLISEAIGQLGIVGKVFGEGARISLVGSEVQKMSAVSSAAIDAGLFTVTSACISMLAIIAGLRATALPVTVRLYASMAAVILACALIFIVAAVAGSWRILGAFFNLLGRTPVLGSWARSKQLAIDETEQALLNFHREAPVAFIASVLLNFLAHALAIVEVYVILRYLSPSATFRAAFIMEGLTKVINLVGSFNPGNVGTYEGGNILIVKLFKLTASAGLTIALCRRVRAIFWAAVGGICLVFIRCEKKGKGMGVQTEELGGSRATGGPVHKLDAQNGRMSAVILADWEGTRSTFSPALAHLATVPILLRNILAAQAEGAARIIVCVMKHSAAEYRSALVRTGRLPQSVEWCEVQDRNLIPIIADNAMSSDMVLVLGNRSYQPKLLREALQRRQPRSLALVSEDEFVGISVVTRETALEIGCSGLDVPSFSRLHSLLQCLRWIEVSNVPSNSFQRIFTREDLCEAERKMEGWLIKPTDGIFARANRRISIPISRHLIKYPISPNMVSLFVLCISLLCGYYYARGGYLNALIAASLGVVGSILDGCDGEVARFKLQSTSFGCWLDTWCDYAWYTVAFIGMGIGLDRMSVANHYFEWGIALIVGAVLTFFIVSLMRRGLAKSHPERLLGMWQEKAENGSSNPLLYLGRNTEFIIRRCFLPYFLLFCAILGITNVLFILAAFGANVAWMIALYSYLVFAREQVGSVNTGIHGVRNA